MKSTWMETSLKQIENRLDSAFKELKNINNKIEKLKEDMDGTGIPNHRNKNTE